MQDERKIKHKIDRTKKKIEDLETRKQDLSKHGYWSLGYWEGRLSVLEDLLDEMEESDNEENKEKSEI